MWKSSPYFILMMGILSPVLWAREIPGGIFTAALPALVPTARISLAPGVRGGGQGGYLTSRLNLEPRPGIRTGLVYGAGESGFHFGAEGDWEVFSAGHWRGTLGGSTVFSREAGRSFFTVGGVGSVGRVFFSEVGVLVPFAGVQVSPSFTLGEGQFEVGVRSTVGLNWELTDWDRANLWVQWGYGLARARSECLVGVSYPLKLL